MERSRYNLNLNITNNLNLNIITSPPVVTLALRHYVRALRPPAPMAKTALTSIHPSLRHVSQRLPSSAIPPRRPASHLTSTLRAELTSRTLPVLYDYLSPTPSHLLNHTLVPFLPPSFPAPSACLSSMAAPAPLLPAGHHLVYFPTAIASTALLPDGTDALHSPGPPYTRRMWAGGRVSLQGARGSALRLDCARAACVERIADVVVKQPSNSNGGASDAEKVFVAIERAIGPCLAEDEPEDELRRRLSAGEGGGASVVERRELVFLRQARGTAPPAQRRIIRGEYSLYGPSLNLHDFLAEWHAQPRGRRPFRTR